MSKGKKSKGKKQAAAEKPAKKQPTRVVRKVGALDTGASRREHQRIEGNVKVVYQLLDEKSLAPKEQWAPFNGVGVASEHTTTAKDLSAGGALFFTDNKMPARSKLGMRIELPDGGGPIRCISEVVRVEEIKKMTIYATAVAFVDIVKVDRKRIQEFVKNEGVAYVIGG